MKNLTISMLVAGMIFSTFAEADFNRIIKNFTNDTCLIVASNQPAAGSVQFDLSACDNAVEPPLPTGTQYCYLPSGQTVGVIYKTASNDTTSGTIEFGWDQFDETVGFSGEDDPIWGYFNVDEGNLNNISDNHGDICIGVAPGQCQPH